MLATQTTYPDFVPNQILTNTQLNELREHLDRQDRSSRRKLVGTGVACGFGWKMEIGAGNTRRLDLFEGLGLTSGGYLVCVCEAVGYTHVRTAYLDPRREANDRTPSYAPWRTSALGDQIELLELVAAADGEPAPDDTVNLHAVHVQDRVLVLYLELEPIEMRSCFVTECDNKGQKVNVNLRALLVGKQHLEKFQMPECEAHEPLVRMPRLHTVKPLHEVTAAVQIDRAYRDIVRSVMPTLVGGIEKAFARYGGTLDLDEEDFRPFWASFESAASATQANQYHYDAVKDMACAYNEAVTAACALEADCCPEADFPRHLMLGALDREAGYRHRFVPSSVRNVFHEDPERVRRLFLRMVEMARAFDPGAAESVRLTPSAAEDAPLGRRAVPYYFPPSSDLREAWQPEMCCTTEKLASYHEHGAHGDLHDHTGDASDLAFDLYNRSAMVRIEGHLGDDCGEALSAIRGERHLHNAEFDVLATDFDDLLKPLKRSQEKIDDLLEGRSDILRRYDQIVAHAVASGEDFREELNAIRQKVAKNDRRVLKELETWIELHCRRRLHCDTAHLEALYADLRGELLCALSGLAADLSKIRDALKQVGDRIPEERVDLSRRVIGTIERHVRWLSDVALPPRLCAFNYAVFIRRYKELTHHAGRFWLIWRLFHYPVRGGKDEDEDEGEGEAEVSLPWPPGSEAVSSTVLALTRGCFHTRFARVSLAFQRIWESDPSYFPNLADQIDGLEHIAGVRRCGTFVLVCDGPANGDRRAVKADFSLSCRLPCCCDVALDDLCLPVVALAGHRVVRLETDDDEPRPVEIEIDLTNAGYEPNFRRSVDDGEVPPLRVELPNKTLLGGTLEMVEGAVVRYKLREPVPGLVDSFPYILESAHECEGRDAAEIAILLEPEPEIPKVPKAPVVTGIIQGHVFFRDKPVPTGRGAYVLVTNADSGETLRRDVGESPEGKPGIYGIKVPAGTYRIRAFAPLESMHLKSAVVEATVAGGDKVVRNLELRMDERPGRVEILVLDPKKIAIRDSTVVLRGPDFERRSARPQVPDHGSPEFPVHVFDEVPAGPYAAEASAPGHETRVLERFIVPAGETVSPPIVLPMNRLRIREGLIVRVAAEENVPVDEARERLVKMYEERYSKRRARVLKAGETNDAVGDSEPYRRAVEFLDTVTHEEVPVKFLARAYRATADGLHRSIAHPASDNAKKKTMRVVLEDVSAAYLDRIMVDEPDEMTPEAKASLRVMVEKLRGSEVDVGDFRESYRPIDVARVSHAPVGRTIADLLNVQ